MRISRALAVAAVVAVLTLGSARLLLLPRTADAQAAVATPNFAVGSQYDTTHVYVAPAASLSSISARTIPPKPSTASRPPTQSNPDRELHYLLIGTLSGAVKPGL